MPKSLLVFAVSFTPEKPNFGTSRTPLEKFLIFFKCLLLKCVYAHISTLNYKKMILKKIQGAEPP